MIQFNEDKQRRKLSQFKRQEEEEVIKNIAAKAGILYLDLTVHPINIDAMRLVHEDQARKANVAPFNLINKKVSLGVLSPNQPETISIIEELKSRKYEPVIYIISHASLEKVWSRYKDLSYSFETKSGALDISSEEVQKLISDVSKIDDIKPLIEKTLNLKKGIAVSRILEIILAGAIAVKASDVHIEPEEDSIRLRYRLDGVLTDILHFDHHIFSLLLSRIKLISNLKINIKNKAQDGRFSIKIGDDEIEVRTSLLPGNYSESVVMRILNPKSISVPLEDLGINKHLLKIILNELKRPNGMILTTGPTGSGKTTTLYAFLKKIHSPDIKIITIENPIEYHLEGIVQTQTDEKAGYSFVNGLRSALRQDPDVIMIGEIRDEETAKTAINAALTGHLVFSTLHTNNAAGSFPRLIDLGANPKTISSAINISMAQRLLRVLCPSCKKKIPLEGAEKEKVDKILSTINESSYLEGIDTSSIYKAGGCSECGPIGYKGRTGIYEAILIDESIEEAVKSNPSEREIEKAAASQNVLNMKQDGIIKVLKGITSLEELDRVIEIQD